MTLRAAPRQDRIDGRVLVFGLIVREHAWGRRYRPGRQNDP
jgi:hypothetical protein